MFEEKPLSITPVSFFALACDCRRLPKKDRFPAFSTHALPSTSTLCHEYPFAQVAIGWNEEGLGFNILVNQPFTQSFFPDIERGDSIELMIDTRDIKTSGFNTRFCHHFYFLPKEVDGQLHGEITHFRTDDNHPLCDPQLLQSETESKVRLFRSNSYEMKIFIPASCLHGYDPHQFDRLGMTYRINRCGGKPQHFSVSSKDYQIDQQPALWASLKLVR